MTSSSNYFSITSGDMLSHDLIYEILLRLPVKSLLRFKSVSKYWFSLIANPSFVKSHLSITRPGDDETLIVLKKPNDVSFSLLDLGSCKIMADLKSPFSQREIPTGKPYLAIVGSVRGIVCVSTCEYDFSTKCTYLWNPTTKMSKLIPPPTKHAHGITRRYHKKPYYCVHFGFGFDPIDNDFKVVSWFCHKVYSTNMNAWRTIPSNSLNYPFPFDCVVCVNRFLCWTSFDNIVALNLNKEVFSSSKLPNGFKHGTIADFNNSIVVIIDTDRECKLGKFGLWMLDDVECLGGGGGAEASWTLMLNINADIPMSIDYVHHYFNRGNLLVSLGRIVFLYNTDKKEYKELPVVSKCWGHMFKYKESLVSITGFTKAECS